MTKEEYKNYIYWLTRRKINDKIEKRCSQCKEWKKENDENYYLKNKSKLELGYTPECKICAKKRANKWRVNNMDKARESVKKNRKTEKTIERERQRDQTDYMKSWRKNHPEKCIEYSSLHRKHDITKTEWKKCLEIFDYKCAYCDITQGEHLKIHKQSLHKEHVDDEGYNDLRNAIPSCKRCNSSKHKFTLEEWYKKQKFFSEEKLKLIYWWISKGYKDYIEEKLPYKIIKRMNKEINKYHYELWSMDEKRNMGELLAIENNKIDLNRHIEKYLKQLKPK